MTKPWFMTSAFIKNQFSGFKSFVIFPIFFAFFYWICSLNCVSKIFQVFWSSSDEDSSKKKFTVHDTYELKLWFNLLIGKTLWFHPFEGEEEERERWKFNNNAQMDNSKVKLF